MAESGVTIPSDSEQYSGAEDLSMSPPSSSSPPLILYQPPTIWGLLRGAAINLFLPFINGMMLGFGELFAHEAAYRLGWGGTRVRSTPVTQSSLEHCSDKRALLREHTTFSTCGKQVTLLTWNQVFPASRRRAHAIGPGIEVVEKSSQRSELEHLTSLE